MGVLLATRAEADVTKDKSSTVTIATATLMGVFILMFLAREATKFVKLGRFQTDDLLILLATVFAIGLSVTTLILSSNGLGVLTTELTLRQANIIMKGYYASDFLYVLTICFTKLSLVAWFYGLVIQNTHRRIIQVLGIFILAWGTASVFAVAFQCGLPRPWEVMTLHCYNSGVFWICFCIVDMTTDVSIIMLSVNLVAYLKLRFSRKALVVACFAPRVLVIVAALVRLVYLYPISPHNKPEYYLWVPVICTQVQVCLSITTACIPYIKPFFQAADDLTRKGMAAASDMYSYGSPFSGYRRSKGKELHSFDSEAVADSLLTYRTPDVSPRIPSPRPLSPMTPPRLLTPPNTHESTSKSSTAPSLTIRIPPPVERGEKAPAALSPQTASSHALSPQCLSPLSPQPLLSPRPFTAARGLTPPPRSHSARPEGFSTPQGNPDLGSSTLPNVFSPPISLSNFPRPPHVQYSPFPPEYTRHPPPPPPPPPLAPNRGPKPASVYRLPRNRASQRFPVRVSSLQQRPVPVVKYSTTPKRAPSESTRISSSSTKDSVTASSPELSGTPVSVPPSPPRIRNQRILTPRNSSRRDQMSPVSPVSPATPLTFWRSENSSILSAGPSAGPSPPWNSEEAEAHWPPAMGDLRGAPRIVIQRPSS